MLLDKRQLTYNRRKFFFVEFEDGLVVVVAGLRLAGEDEVEALNLAQTRIVANFQLCLRLQQKSHSFLSYVCVLV